MILLGVDMILLDVDPNVVKPGWVAFIVVLLLGIAMVFLYFSMRKQFRKIRIPEDDVADSAEDSVSERPPHTQS
jgi:protein-S-isoprenylcysteine O-methyltransferase Ste14